MSALHTPIDADTSRRLLAFASQRLSSFADEVSKLERGEFPYPAAQLALRHIKAVLEDHAEMIDMLSEESDLETLNQVCKRQLTDLWNYLPLLGFILRSTNVRNAFEVCMPLQRLAWGILGDEARILVSSEWEYSPYIYNQIPILPGFILIGMPAHESGNPLLVPMTGHELGHAIWGRIVEKSLWHPAFTGQMKRFILDRIRTQWVKFQKLFPDVSKQEELDTELFATAHWMPAYAWALQQCEEYFCDFVGIRLFGESFLYAFGHLLAPVLEGQRASHYPNMMRRVRAQLRAAETYGVETPIGYESWFQDSREIADEDVQEKFLVELADKAADQLVPQLIEHADSLLTQPSLPEWKTPLGNARRAKEVARIFDDFSLVAPSECFDHLADLVNAGWKAALAQIPQVSGHVSADVLRELILKSMEVLEFEAKMEGGSYAKS